MTDRFSDLMTTKVSDIEPPKPLPNGLYHATYTKWNLNTINTRNGETPVLDLTFQISAPVDDIDLEGATLPTSRSYRVWSRRNDEGEIVGWDHRLRKLVEKTFGLDPDEQLNQILEDAIGTEVIVEVEQRVNPNDPEEVFWDIKSVRPADSV